MSFSHFPARALALAALLSCLSSPAWADPKLPELTLGEHQAGPEQQAEDLRRSVVVLCPWRADHEPSAKAWAAALALDTKLRCEELVLIAVGSPKEGEDPFAGRSLYSGLRYGGRAPRVATIVAQGGAKAFEGKPESADFARALRATLAQAKPPLSSGLDEARVLAQLKVAEEKERPGRAIAGLRRLLEKGSPAEVKQARLLIARLERWGQRALEAIDPSKALATSETLDRLRQAYAKHPLGRAATERLRDLKRESAFRSELAASKLLRKLQALASKLVPCATCGGSLSFGGADDAPHVALGCTGCRQQNRSAAGALEGGLRKVIQKHPQTLAAKRAKQLADRLFAPVGGGIGFGG